MSLAPPLEIGFVIGGKYRLVREIGQGGLGVVYEAEHLRIGQRVAIKVLATQRSARQVLARFEREARVMAQLSSPHVAVVHDADVLEDGGPYIVMEYLAGWDLHHQLERHGGVIPTADAVRIVCEAAEGVAQAHEAGIVHRDLKPSNLFLARVGSRTVVKLLDFGVSKILGDEDELTGTGVTLGTAAYMSPEHVRSSRSVDARSDLWSLGVILFRALSGRLPFHGEGPLGTALAIVTEPPLRLSDFRPDLPPELVRIVHRLLDKDPSARFQSARELIFALSHFLLHDDAPISERDATIMRPPPKASVRMTRRESTPTITGDLAPESPTSTQQVVLTSVATARERAPRDSRRVFGPLVLLVALVTIGAAIFVLLDPSRVHSARPLLSDMKGALHALRASDVVRAVLDGEPIDVRTPVAPSTATDAGAKSAVEPVPASLTTEMPRRQQP